MSYDYIHREIERLRRRIKEEIDRTLSMFETARTGWSPDGTLEPLHNVYEYSDRYVILLDLAGADTGSIEVKATRDMLIIEAKLERSISFSDIFRTHQGREISFHSYRHTIPLPPDADPKGMRVNVRPNKMVEVIIPKKGRR
ncbi:MAG: Hsp20/alpha crystallin family protein [Pyrodictiaceae archaeon]